MKIRFLVALFLLISGSVVELRAEGQAIRPNVLFIAIDDLRPALGCYGDKTAITPHIDRLASSGTVFNRAYCQEAVCAPSRLSLMSGRRPDTIQVWDLGTHFRKTLPQVVTLPQHFKDHGYETRSIGKIYHGSGPAAKDPPSWTVDPTWDTHVPAELRYVTPENLAGKGLKRASTEAAAVADERYVEGVVCREALEVLEGYAETGQPFFLAVGFRKPHLPFCAPQRYWDLYDRAEIPGPATTAHPDGAPEWACRSWGELEGYTDISSDGLLSEEKVQELRHGYYACVSYVDALVGRLLDQLEATGLMDKTVICLWGDHGFHLGEQGLWTKANNYELSTRVPLLLAVPGQASPGSKTNALVELIDVYPTLAEACGLPVPEGVEGRSLRVLLDDPDERWAPSALSQWPRARRGNRHRGPGDIMGYALRTRDFRYVEWRDWVTKEAVAAELYDLKADPHESRNCVEDPRYAEMRRQHEAMLEERLTGARAALRGGSEKEEGSLSEPLRSP